MRHPRARVNIIFRTNLVTATQNRGHRPTWSRICFGSNLTYALLSYTNQAVSDMKKTTKTTNTKALTPAKKKTAAKAPKASTPAVKKPAPAVKKTTPAPVVTTITAAIDVGFGNALYVRGQGPGLNWEKGVLMDCVADDKWALTIAESAGPVTFKFLLNDETWCAGDDLTIAVGESGTFTPEF